MISEELRKEFASGILISDVNSYVDTHKSKYEEWLKTKNQKPPIEEPKIKPKEVKTDETTRYEVYKT